MNSKFKRRKAKVQVKSHAIELIPEGLRLLPIQVLVQVRVLSVVGSKLPPAPVLVQVLSVAELRWLLVRVLFAMGLRLLLPLALFVLEPALLYSKCPRTTYQAQIQR